MKEVDLTKWGRSAGTGITEHFSAAATPLGRVPRRSDASELQTDREAFHLMTEFWNSKTSTQMT